MTDFMPGPAADLDDKPFHRQAGRTFLVALYAAFRNLRLYPVENAAVQRALDELELATSTMLDRDGKIEIRLSGDFVFINGTRLRLEMDNYASFTNVQTLLRVLEVRELVVVPGVTRKEWQQALVLTAQALAHPEAAERFPLLLERAAAAGITHLKLYEGEDTGGVSGGGQAKEQALRTYSQGVSVSRELFTNARLGRTTNMRRAKRAVQLIVDQVLNNEMSLMGLTTLRDHDSYTFTHSVNVCIFAVAVGRRLGLTKTQLYDLGLTALLHDIGKARIGQDVLNKDTELTQADWSLIQSHTWRGALALFQLRGLDETPYRAIEVAYSHHRKVDLTGYPARTRTGEMSLYSRLVAAADGFDAATTQRTYQAELGPDEVLKEMWTNPRRGYDPVMVKALINVVGVYPLGTVVILDTYEVAVVVEQNRESDELSRPMVALVIDRNGVPVPAPGQRVNLMERGIGGEYRRTIVKVTSANKYGVEPAAYFT